ncbi:tail fiber protein [Flavobacterium poyangense]|uniref:tail fiber protein n=1 Tax=Flavobacterium poyangense TaxID=2204302 RepID=UPI00141E99EA|nr:tail fiber protein [Flavobacterium sp. JXAS1]
MNKKICAAIFLISLILNAQNLLAQDEALKILPNGNVGIGVATPLEPLHVNGKIKAEGRIADKTGNVSPVGSIMIFAGNTAPPGWLFCDGASYDRNGDKNELYNVIGIVYGSPDNNRFNVPDLRERFVMGGDNRVPAEKLGSKGEPDLHNHAINAFSNSFKTSSDGFHAHKFPKSWYKRDFGGSSYSGIDTGGENIKNTATEPGGEHDHSVLVSFPASVSGSSQGPNRPKWMSLNYIIKY